MLYWLQVEFFKLVQAGDHSRALKVASSHLGPLATKDPALLKPLKETLLALLRSTEEPIGKHLSLDALATSLQVGMLHMLGVYTDSLQLNFSGLSNIKHVETDHCATNIH